MGLGLGKCSIEGRLTIITRNKIPGSFQQWLGPRAGRFLQLSVLMRVMLLRRELVGDHRGERDPRRRS